MNFTTISSVFSLLLLVAALVLQFLDLFTLGGF